MVVYKIADVHKLDNSCSEKKNSKQKRPSLIWWAAVNMLKTKAKRTMTGPGREEPWHTSWKLNHGTVCHMSGIQLGILWRDDACWRRPALRVTVMCYLVRVVVREPSPPPPPPSTLTTADVPDVIQVLRTEKIKFNKAELENFFHGENIYLQHFKRKKGKTVHTCTHARIL